MTHQPAEQRLYALWGEIRDLRAVEDLLEWDQETCMPEQADEARAKTLATVVGLRHRHLTSPELLDLLDECEAAADEGSIFAAQVQEARRLVARAIRVPEDLARAIAEARTTGLSAWRAARQEADFRQFQPSLERLLELRREEAAAILPDGTAYDAMLDAFEPGATEAELEPLFARLRGELSPLVRGIVDRGVTVDESAARGHFPAERQVDFGRRMAAAFGFDFARGRIDPSTHPFCVGVAPTDVRMTYRHQDDDFRPCFFGIIHETGHGLYEQGLPEAWRRTPIGESVSLGVHESQSRLWENHVGRSRGFWSWAADAFRKTFPNAELDLDALWPALHTVRPSFIRVEADEATYNLHIAIRFEIERALFGRTLEVADLPAAWNDLYEETLGIRAPDDAVGVLQDIHWSQGSFGYFPTYTLGTMTAAQLFVAAGRDLGDLEDAFSRGEFRPLLDWLRENVHIHGSRYPAGELVERATGRPLSPDDLLDYLRRTTGEAYG